MYDSNKGNILFFVYLEKLLKNLLNFWEHRNIFFLFLLFEKRFRNWKLTYWSINSKRKWKILLLSICVTLTWEGTWVFVSTLPLIFFFFGSLSQLQSQTKTHPWVIARAAWLGPPPCYIASSVWPFFSSARLWPFWGSISFSDLFHLSMLYFGGCTLHQSSFSISPANDKVLLFLKH